MNETKTVRISDEILWVVCNDTRTQPAVAPVVETIKEATQKPFRPVVGDATQFIKKLAREHKWSIRCLGRGVMPIRKVKIENFIYEPLILSESTTPPVALNRANEILKHIATPQGFLIGKPIEKPKPIMPKVEVDWERIGKSAEDALTLIGTVAGAMATVGVGLMMASLALIDPSVVIVTQDGTFIEIYRDYV